jgi:hypothetical protein
VAETECRAYIWHIAHAIRDDRDEFVAFVKERREQYQQAVAHLKAPGRKLLRVHGKFATIYAAGCAAIRFKIFPFTEADLLEGVMTCERDHIAFIAKELGGANALDANAKPIAAPNPSAYARMNTYVFGAARKRFVDLREPDAVVTTLARRSPRGIVISTIARARSDELSSCGPSKWRRSSETTVKKGRGGLAVRHDAPAPGRELRDNLDHAAERTDLVRAIDSTFPSMCTIL